MSDEPDCPHELDCVRKIVQLRATVYGNGHPEDSLIVRVCSVEKQLAVIKRLSWATVSGVALLVFKFLGAWLETIFR